MARMKSKFISYDAIAKEVFPEAQFANLSKIRLKQVRDLFAETEKKAPLNWK